VIDLIFPNRSFEELRTSLLKSNLETCTLLYTKVIERSRGKRLLINGIQQVPEDAYSRRSPVTAQLHPNFIAPIIKKAEAQRLGLVFVHTHPHADGHVHFSATDDEGEFKIDRFLKDRAPSQIHASLVIGRDSVAARVIGPGEKIRVIEVGSRFRILSDDGNILSDEGIYDRQVRAFGPTGQSALKRIRVGIVGLGGTGSVIGQLLAHLGVEDYLLIDPDVIETSNLNRLIGGRVNDVGSFKVDVAARNVQEIRNEARITKIRGSVLDASVARSLTDSDFFFCCTDSHASRAVLNQLTYQYFLPSIDVGVSISASELRVSHVTGRVQMLAPGLACLTCLGLLNADAIRHEFMTPERRNADPYFTGNGGPQPAVISLNSTMASLGITMFLGAVTGIPAESRYQIYNGITGNVRSVTSSVDPICIVCSKRGALGRGNEWPLPARLK